MKRLESVLGWATGLSLLAGSAVSQEAAPAVATPVEASDSARTHDGFFFRIGLNVGPLIMNGQYTVEHQEGHLYESETRGSTFAPDVMFGGTVSDGLAIGGALIGATTWPATRTSEAYPSGTRTDPVILFGLVAFANYSSIRNLGFTGKRCSGFPCSTTCALATTAIR